MNLGDTVYAWTTRAMFDYKVPSTELPKLSEPVQDPNLNWRQAQAILHDFTILQVVALRLDRERGIYSYIVRSSRDIQDKQGVTRIFFDANSGELKLLLLPSGQYAGNTVTNWLYALHMANVFGLPYRIFVCIAGFVIALLSVTGVMIWMKKRRTRANLRSS